MINHKLTEEIEAILGTDKSIYAAAKSRFDNLAKPLGSLGQLEELTAKICAAQGTIDADIDKRCALVMCADNGVVSQGVSQCGYEVTTAICKMLVEERASICNMSKVANCKVFPVDVGIRDDVEGMVYRKARRGTSDITRCCAMRRDEAEYAILVGSELVHKMKEEGYKIIATGEAGIGNTTTATAMSCVFLNKTPAELTGRGAGLSTEGLSRKIAAIEKAIKTNKPNAEKPIDVLAKIGGFDIAALTGIFIGGALYHVPIIMDGIISATAALCASRICKDVLDYIIPSHRSAEPAFDYITSELNLHPIINAGMRLGEGTGAVALLPMLDMSFAVYKSSTTFESIGIESYKEQK